MTDTIFTNQTPGFDDFGVVTNRSVGMRFQVSASGRQIVSGRYWVPAAGIGTGTLFQIWDGTTKLLEVDLNTAIPSPILNNWNTVPIGSAITPAAVQNYVVCAYLLGASHYRYSSGQTLPVGSGGTVSADTAIFRENAGSAVPPNNTGFTGGFYFVDVNVETAGTSGTGALTAAAAVLTASGSLNNSGTGALIATAATLRGSDAPAGLPGRLNATTSGSPLSASSAGSGLTSRSSGSQFTTTSTP